MLSRKQCPHTGIVNFFETSDPHIAIGSAIKQKAAGTYRWLSFVADCDNGGIATDLRGAERQILRLNLAAIEMARNLADCGGRSISDAA